MEQVDMTGWSPPTDGVNVSPSQLVGLLTITHTSPQACQASVVSRLIDSASKQVRRQSELNYTRVNSHHCRQIRKKMMRTRRITMADVEDMDNDGEIVVGEKTNITPVVRICHTDHQGSNSRMAAARTRLLTEDQLMRAQLTVLTGGSETRLTRPVRVQRAG